MAYEEITKDVWIKSVHFRTQEKVCRDCKYQILGCCELAKKKTGEKYKIENIDTNVCDKWKKCETQFKSPWKFF